MVRLESSLRATGFENSTSSNLLKMESSFDPRSKLPGCMSSGFHSMLAVSRYVLHARIVAHNRSPTGVYGLYFSMQEVNGLQQLYDGALDKLLVETTSLHENCIHVTETHLRDLKS